MNENESCSFMSVLLKDILMNYLQAKRYFVLLFILSLILVTPSFIVLYLFFLEVIYHTRIFIHI